MGVRHINRIRFTTHQPKAYTRHQNRIQTCLVKVDKSGSARHRIANELPVDHELHELRGKRYEAKHTLVPVASNSMSSGSFDRCSSFSTATRDYRVCGAGAPSK